MPTGLKIILFIVLGLIAIYLLSFIVILNIVIKHKKEIKKTNKALCVAYTTKIDLYTSLRKILIDKGVEIKESITKALNYVDVDDFLDQDSIECKEGKEKLTYINEELMMLISERKYRNNIQINSIVQSLNEIEFNTRMLFIEYNTNVLTYNFWIQFVLYKFLFFILRYKVKECL